jgi:hypothetical protein
MSNLEFLTENDPAATDIEHPQKGRSIVKDFNEKDNVKPLPEKATTKRTTTTKKTTTTTKKKSVAVPSASPPKNSINQGVVWMSNAGNIAPHAVPASQKVVNTDELEISLEDKELMNGDNCTQGKEIKLINL